MATNNANEDHTPDKGVTLGGLGGAVVGGAAGSSAGPVGTVIGIVAGGIIGAGVSEVVENATHPHHHHSKAEVNDGAQPTSPPDDAKRH